MTIKFFQKVGNKRRFVTRWYKIGTWEYRVGLLASMKKFPFDQAGKEQTYLFHGNDGKPFESKAII